MKRMTARSFLEFSLPSDVRISPDGSLCAFLVRRADEQTDSYRSDLWVLERAAGTLRPLTARANVQSYLFLPDGRLAFPDGDFERGSGGGVRTRWLAISPYGGEARPCVTLPVDADSAQVLPDGRWLVTARTRPGTVEKDGCCRVFDELPFWRNGRGDTNGVRTSLFLCDPSRQTAEQLTDTWFDTGEVLVQDGTVVFSGVSWRDMCPIYEGLYAADLSGGGVRTLIEPGQFRLSGPFPLGGGKVAVQLAGREGNPYAAGDIWEVDTRTGQKRMILPFERGLGHGAAISTDSCAAGGQTVAADGGLLYFTMNTGEDCRIFTMAPDGTVDGPLSGPGSVSCFDVRGGAVYMVAMRQGALPELYVLENGEERQLSNFNGWVGQTYELPQPQPLSFFDEDGFEIHGFVLPPAGYRPGRKYPAVLTIHGGPRGSYGAVFFHEMQMFAARGYFVFFCNPRGSDGRGTAFADLLGRYGDIDYRNLMQFADECLRLWPDADPGRLCVMGGSYGGYMTSWMIGHTDRFRAACAQRSICDWISYAGTSDLGSWFNGHEHGAGIERKLGLLWDISPISCAEKANTPTLFIHSDEDYRCHMVHALRMFTSLRMRGVDSRIVLFSGENHDLSRSGRPRSRIRRLEEMAAWMDKYCLV